MTNPSFSEEDDCNLTVRQAFEAARLCIHAYWERGGSKSDDLALLLGDIEMMPDHGTADPAQWRDWLETMDAVAAGRNR